MTFPAWHHPYIRKAWGENPTTYAKIGDDPDSDRVFLNSPLGRIFYGDSQESSA